MSEEQRAAVPPRPEGELSDSELEAAAGAGLLDMARDGIEWLGNEGKSPFWGAVDGALPGGSN